jgi:hypothetical protein
MRGLTVLLVLIASWAAPRLEATVIVQAELPDLVAEARTIVHGRVISTEPRAVNGGRSIDTLVVIEADDYLKGNLGARLAVRVPGGQIGSRRALVIGAPMFRSGEQVILFLGGSGPALPWIVGLNQGVFRVRQDGVRRLGKSGIDELQVFQEQAPHVRSGSAAHALPLALFKSRVRSLVNEGGAR